MTQKKISSAILAAEATVRSPVPQEIPIGESNAKSAATIQVEKDGNVVNAINVCCSCGNHLRIVCVYPAPAS